MWRAGTREGTADDCQFDTNAYSVSAYVAASRLHENRHHLSDVIFGAAVGTVAGRTVTRHGRETWTVAATPLRGGMYVGLAR